MPDDVAYAITKAIVENRDAIVAEHKAMAGFVAKEAWRPENVGIPLHPGRDPVLQGKGLDVSGARPRPKAIDARREPADRRRRRRRGRPPARRSSAASSARAGWWRSRGSRSSSTCCGTRCRCRSRGRRTSRSRSRRSSCGGRCAPARAACGGGSTGCSSPPPPRCSPTTSRTSTGSTRAWRTSTTVLTRDLVFGTLVLALVLEACAAWSAGACCG